MMPPKQCAFASWAKLKSKFVGAAKKWQTQKRRTEVAQMKAEQSHRVWTAHCVWKDAAKQEMTTALAVLKEAFPNADAAKLTPFLEGESHSSGSESGSTN